MKKKTWTDEFVKIHRKEIEEIGWIRNIFRRNDGRCNTWRIYHGSSSSSRKG